MVTLVPVSRRRPVPVNLNTAPEKVLLALFGPSRRGLVSSIVPLRDAAPLRSIEPVAVLVDPLVMDQVRAFADVRSRFFFVAAEAVQEGVRARKLTLAARDESGSLTVLRWIN
jgi:type II secretory pathway component PulK